MNDLEKIKKLNDNLKVIRKNGEIEIEELVQKEIRILCDIFNKDNSNLVELICLAGMGGCTFYLESKDIFLRDLNDSFNIDCILDSINSFNDGLDDYIEDNEEPFEERIIISEEFLNKYNELINIIKDIDKTKNIYSFFDLDDLNFDSREPAFYYILENEYEMNIKDETFLDLIASKTIDWKHKLSDNFFNVCKPLKSFDNDLIENKNFNNEYEIFNSLNYKKIKEISKHLILESNLFNNTTHINDAKISLIQDNKNFWNNIVNFRKENYSDSDIFNMLKVGLQYGKPSEIFSNVIKDIYLKNLGIYRYPKENLNNNLSLLEQTKDYNQLKANDFFEKMITSIENLDLDKELNLIKENLKLEFKVENKREQTSFVKSFDNLQEVQNYIDKINNIKFFEL